YLHLGTALWQVGRAGDSLSAAVQAETRLRVLAEEEPEESETRYYLAAAIVLIGELHLWNDLAEEAGRELRTALVLLGKLATEKVGTTSNIRYRVDQGLVCDKLGQLEKDAARSLAWHEKANAIFEKLGKETEWKDATILRYLAKNNEYLGLAQFRRGEHA